MQTRYPSSALCTSCETSSKTSACNHRCSCLATKSCLTTQVLKCSISNHRACGALGAKTRSKLKAVTLEVRPCAVCTSSAPPLPIRTADSTSSAAGRTRTNTRMAPFRSKQMGLKCLLIMAQTQHASCGCIVTAISQGVHLEVENRIVHLPADLLSLSTSCQGSCLHMDGRFTVPCHSTLQLYHQVCSVLSAPVQPQQSLRARAAPPPRARVPGSAPGPCSERQCRWRQCAPALHRGRLTRCASLNWTYAPHQPNATRHLLQLCAQGSELICSCLPSSGGGRRLAMRSCQLCGAHMQRAAQCCHCFCALHLFLLKRPSTLDVDEEGSLLMRVAWACP